MQKKSILTVMLTSCLFSTLPISASAAESQILSLSQTSPENSSSSSVNLLENKVGSAVYRSLNKDWLYFSLYKMSRQASTSEVEFYSKLEFNVVSKRFSLRKFRRFWLDTVVVEHGTDLLRKKGEDFDLFFSAVQGALKQADFISIELMKAGTKDAYTLFSINYQPLVRLHQSFLPLLAQSLLGTHPPSVHFKRSLLGIKPDSSPEIKRYQQMKPSLARISQVQGWAVRQASELASNQPASVDSPSTLTPPQADSANEVRPTLVADEG